MKVDSVTIIKNGFTVLDFYYYPYSARKKHRIYNLTKAFVSTLIGIAAD